MHAGNCSRPAAERGAGGDRPRMSIGGMEVGGDEETEPWGWEPSTGRRQQNAYSVCRYTWLFPNISDIYQYLPLFTIFPDISRYFPHPQTFPTHKRYQQKCPTPQMFPNVANSSKRFQLFPVLPAILTSFPTFPAQAGIVMHPIHRAALVPHPFPTRGLSLHLI